MFPLPNSIETLAEDVYYPLSLPLDIFELLQLIQCHCDTEVKGVIWLTEISRTATAMETDQDESLSFLDKPNNIADLQERIREEIGKITPQMLYNVKDETYHRLGCCQQVNGRNFMSFVGKFVKLAYLWITEVIHVLVRCAQLKELLLFHKVFVKTQEPQLVTDHNNLIIVGQQISHPFSNICKVFGKFLAYQQNTISTP
ncbi:hypothetical protein NQ318_017865 [Aromia moschata]|uniref:Uncharacterized protein n=1 Tax=Aromia moschata TaxID=1265417 RepID=A0AAV8XSK7_9CUCU|nr:hypothetical protein NQ318_017865 [Aromia moschata]